MSELPKIKCAPCKKSEPPMPQDKANELFKELDEGWYMEENHHLEREFPFKNFQEALNFTNVIGRIAEEEGHHPEIFLTWGKVSVTLYTHKIDGLSLNDFILASKIDKAFKAFLS